MFPWEGSESTNCHLGIEEDGIGQSSDFAGRYEIHPGIPVGKEKKVRFETIDTVIGKIEAILARPGRKERAWERG